MAVRQVIGVVPQELALYDDLTARENLAFWGQMYNLGGKALKARVTEVLEQIGLTEKAVDNRLRRILLRCRELLLQRGLSLDDLL